MHAVRRHRRASELDATWPPSPDASAASTIALASASVFFCFFFFLTPSASPPLNFSLPPVNDMLPELAARGYAATAAAAAAASILATSSRRKVAVLCSLMGRLRNDEVVGDNQKHDTDPQPVLSDHMHGPSGLLVLVHARDAAQMRLRLR